MLIGAWPRLRLLGLLRLLTSTASGCLCQPNCSAPDSETNRSTVHYQPQPLLSASDNNRPIELADDGELDTIPNTPTVSTRVLDTWKTLSGKMAELLEQHAVNYSEADMLAGMARFSQRLNDVHTGSQLSTLVNSRVTWCLVVTMQALLFTRSRLLHPESRRKPGITRGAKRQLAGRPPNGQSAAVKRPRNLAHNIETGVPNAKSHGQGH